MAGPLPFAKPDDPRLDAVIAANIRRFRFDPGYIATVRGLATGETNARTMRCCGSGCRPCVQDVLRCTAQCLMDLQEPNKPPEPPPGPLGGRGRAMALRIAQRLRGVQTPPNG